MVRLLIVGYSGRCLEFFSWINQSDIFILTLSILMVSHSTLAMY